MDLSLTEDQELIASTARELLESRAATAGVRALGDDPAGYSAALWKEMVELGWTGLPFPEEHGGVGGDFLDVCLLFEQLGYAQVPSPLLTSVACCGMPVSRFGTSAQKQRWLDAIANGEIVTAAPLPWDRPGRGRWRRAPTAGSSWTGPPRSSRSLRPPNTSCWWHASTASRTPSGWRPPTRPCNRWGRSAPAAPATSSWTASGYRPMPPWGPTPPTRSPCSARRPPVRRWSAPPSVSWT
ncbi:acyl-CoA dehydrogenase family protein [Actinomadura madurae]|uniref:acyl-CoA dehydrogenase family protein n=1 Tax=Actinomadura madurae TaxID=1993 RepID=UPI0020D24CB2|nr:acyl-CoA dehydrogenase family protein [Actinomadura madurae]MCP9968023.1 acyl-CoA dehydrogenase family protein [Actinomadura madurae]